MNKIQTTKYSYMHSKSKVIFEVLCLETPIYRPYKWDASLSVVKIYVVVTFVQLGQTLK